MILLLLACTDPSKPLDSDTGSDTGSDTAAPACAAPSSPPSWDPWGGDTRASLDATGFFRTEKLCDRWWLVTPDGHPFVSIGVNSVNPSQGAGQTTGQDRYAETVAATYASQPDWAATTADRLHTWGFNTVGSWSNHSLFRADTLGDTGLSFAINLRLSGGDWLSGAVADWFDPAWEAHVQTSAAEQITPWLGDPQVLGWFIDNETRWGPDWRGSETLLQLYLSLPPEAPGKIEAVRFLLAQLGSLDALNARLGTSFADEAALLASQDGWPPLTNDDPLTTAWLSHAASRYFTTTTAAIRAVDPDHLILGNRDVSVMTRLEVFQAAAPTLDVLSINNYTFIEGLPQVAIAISGSLDPADGFAALHDVIDAPILITEFSFRSDESDVPNDWPPNYPTYATQAERTDAFLAYATAHQAVPWIVGYHWFEWVDEPVEGRFDGEDSNFGLVAADDTPYEALTTQMSVTNPAWYTQLTLPTP